VTCSSSFFKKATPAFHEFLSQAMRFLRPYQYKYIADATVSTVRLGLGKQGRFCLSMTHLRL
jgi:hypothetical protein